MFLQPVAIGKAVHPLRSLLQSKELSQSVLVPVQSLEGIHQTQEIGPLKVIYSELLLFVYQKIVKIGQMLCNLF